MMKKIFLNLLLTILVGTPNAWSQNIKVDPKLSEYKKSSGIGGSLSAVGSDTLNNVMTLWGEQFSKLYPNVHIQIEGKGSATAPPALLAGTAQLGPMSREMKEEEINEFRKKYGYEPLKIGVALDALTVFVNKNNPLDKIDFNQLDGVFSSTYKGGGKNIENWDELNKGPTWTKKPIRLYGRNSASGTYAYFKEHVLFKGDFKSSVKERPGSAAVVQSIAEDLYGIGYSGLGYITSNVKPLKVASKSGGDFAAPTYENVLSNKYPISRLLYIYVLKDPKKPLDKNIEEFLKYVLSKEGQEVVIKDGYLPLTATMVTQQLGLVK